MIQFNNKKEQVAVKCLFIAIPIGILLNTDPDELASIVQPIISVAVIWLVVLACVWLNGRVPIYRPKRNHVTHQNANLEPSRVIPCPYCAEEIKSSAIVCKHCRTCLSNSRNNLLLVACVLLIVFMACHSTNTAWTGWIDQISDASSDIVDIKSDVDDLKSDIASIRSDVEDSRN